MSTVTECSSSTLNTKSDVWLRRNNNSLAISDVYIYRGGFLGIDSMWSQQTVTNQASSPVYLEFMCVTHGRFVTVSWKNQQFTPNSTLGSLLFSAGFLTEQPIDQNHYVHVAVTRMTSPLTNYHAVLHISRNYTDVPDSPDPHVRITLNLTSPTNFVLGDVYQLMSGSFTYRWY